MLRIVSSSRSGAGQLETVVTGDNLLILEGVTLQGTNAESVIFIDGSNIDTTIDGRVLGDVGIKIGNDSLDAFNTITVSASGSVIGTLQIAIAVFGGGSSTIDNSGLIAGQSNAINFGALERSTLINSGRIFAEGDAITSGGGEALTITNSGSIVSYDSSAIVGSFANDSIVNSGFIRGDILLSLGNDSYNGDGGRVRGAISGGGGNDTLSGGAGTDNISGDNNNDHITGRGGIDGLTGGSGSDRFIYNALSEVRDIITDFTTADFLVFKKAAFGNLATGTLSSAAFRANLSGQAQDATDRFIYETDRDILWYDANGSAAGGRVLITDFAYDVNLTRSDILIIA